MVAEQRIIAAPRLTPFVGAVIATNAAVFVLLHILSAVSQEAFQLAERTIYLTPALVLRGWVWQLFTHAFAHFDFLHIFLNMAILYLFGCRIESVLGTRQFARLYFFGVLGSGVLCVLVPFLPGIGGQALFRVMVLGASGAVFAVCVTYACMFPNDIIYVFLLVPMRAKWAVLLFVAVAFLGLISAGRGNIANQAHLGGALFGYIFYKWQIQSPPWGGGGPRWHWPRRRKKPLTDIDRRFREIAKELRR